MVHIVNWWPPYRYERPWYPPKRLQKVGQKENYHPKVIKQFPKEETKIIKLRKVNNQEEHEALMKLQKARREARQEEHMARQGMQKVKIRSEISKRDRKAARKLLIKQHRGIII
jgi:hypothetical protein